MKIEIEQRYLFAQQLAQKAGEIALNFYLHRDKLRIECKNAPQDLVSIADSSVEQIIKTELKQHFPHDGFLGEESSSDNLKQKFCWVVDPIDGTSPFLYGLHSWCISIAVIQNQQEIVIGIVFDPLHNELFHTMLNAGAFLNNQRIQTAKARSLKDGLTGIGTSHRVSPNKFTPFLQQLLLDGGMFIRNGSGALMLSYVAAGRLIGYFEPDINSWDVLAALLLIHEAGGKTNNFLANNGLLKGNYILASCSEDIFTKLDKIRCQLSLTEKEHVDKFSLF